MSSGWRSAPARPCPGFRPIARRCSRPRCGAGCRS
uniref:Uncharacterized protein n=1 Tax=Magnetospirillum gryphiswaldense TaxID=55518 RepID=A4TTU1_9PROT|nr:hypothetical protein MGR_1470 [Magnetospirillum gryphiswaldense MSR-1]